MARIGAANPGEFGYSLEFHLSARALQSAAAGARPLVLSGTM
ncbi:MAG: hypothetical protein N3I86_07200 [Verrucomicrobiae bacterium]|nr:hypothetical protein [Verrucomicrobiae bacterium]MDW8310660.1 hypothetical protein [Verrucomicrobiales bacterium]